MTRVKNLEHLLDLVTTWGWVTTQIQYDGVNFFRDSDSGHNFWVVINGDMTGDMVFNKNLCFFSHKKRRLKCILRTPIHPLKGDSPYSPFHSPFLRVNHPSRRVNGSLKRRFTLQKGWTHSPLRVNHPSVRVNHPPNGWITLLKGEWSIRVNWKRVNEGWITLFKGEWKKIKVRNQKWILKIDFYMKF